MGIPVLPSRATPGAVLAGDAFKAALAMGAVPAVRKLPGRRDA